MEGFNLTRICVLCNIHYTIHKGGNKKNMNKITKKKITLTAERKEMNRALNTELFSRWISYIDSSPKTVNTYSKAIKQFFIYLKAKQISRPQREDIIKYRDYLKESHKPTTVQNYLAAVKLFFVWTQKEDFYPNIAERVKGTKLSTAHKKDYLTTKQVNKLLGAINRETLKGKRDYAILSLMVTTGLRTVSIINADIGDIRTVGDNTVLFYKGKGREEKSSYVKLAYPVEEAIRYYLSVRDETNGTSPLFSSVANRNSGKRMTTRSISRIAKERLIDINLKSDRITAHSLRHTATTLNLLNGGTIEETQQLLGHSNINTTMVYSHALKREQNNSEQRIATAIFG